MSDSLDVSVPGAQNVQRLIWIRSARTPYPAPVFEIEVFEDGQVRFKGRYFVNTQDEVLVRLDRQQIERAIAALKAISPPDPRNFGFPKHLSGPAIDSGRFSYNPYEPAYMFSTIVQFHAGGVRITYEVGPRIMAGKFGDAVRRVIFEELGLSSHFCPVRFTDGFSYNTIGIDYCAAIALGDKK